MYSYDSHAHRITNKMLNVKLKVRSRELLSDEGCWNCNVGLRADYRVDRHQAGDYMTLIDMF